MEDPFNSQTIKARELEFERMFNPHYVYIVYCQKISILDIVVQLRPYITAYNLFES